MSNTNHRIITSHVDTDVDFFDDQPKQKIKIRRKKIQGDNPIKKYIVKRKNTDIDFVGHFLTTTTTTESPTFGQFTNSKALNRTQEDSRCKYIRVGRWLKTKIISVLILSHC